MTTYPFELTDDINLIILLASVDGYELRLALDAGASNTVVDLTALLIAGYRLSETTAQVEIETGKGVITADVYTIRTLDVLGIRQADFTIFSYDFLANSILTDIDGVLGLDFFKGRKLCIDFAKSKSLCSKPEQ